MGKPSPPRWTRTRDESRAEPSPGCLTLQQPGIEPRLQWRQPANPPAELENVDTNQSPTEADWEPYYSQPL
ncbi:hypothetical protein HanRHA438_Chr08g0371361 [Helianthus annuus]|nr:hypothetical protein HanHA300_Chr08g0296731 [Helianthus annuus]KAJ0555046.1 hypothetical protein HanHA89_Chr08g0315231 [Helianthus annuus]KAJ0720613.1 hypothetical protein HanLR1_Chr08g0295581 [Helianthus annuus]KAJ0899679.1 hypothetical protein HanRHA438_Chr08g0371361 [Helianthus annuus]